MPVQLVQSNQTVASACQWTGEASSLMEIQSLLFPASPCLAPYDLTELRTKSIGVWVSWPTTRRFPYELAWADVGSWIVRAGDRVEIVATDVEFRARFVVLEAPGTTTVAAASPASPPPAPASANPFYPG